MMLNVHGVVGTRTLPRKANGGLCYADKCHRDDMVSSIGGVMVSAAGVRVWSWFACRCLILAHDFLHVLA